MIVEGLEFRATELTEAQLRAGLAAAHAVLAEAGVTPFEGAVAQDIVRFYDEITYSTATTPEEIRDLADRQEGCVAPTPPTPAQQTAYAAYDRAYDAALEAVGNPEPAKLTDFEFRAVPVEVQAFA